MITIHQGDQYAIPFSVKRNNITQTAQTITRMEILIGSLRKTYPGDIEYYSATQQFLFPLMQNESFALEENTYDVLCRPLYSDGTITGWKSAGTVRVEEMEGAETL